MSDNGRRLSKRSGAIKQGETLERKRQGEKQKTLAKNCQVKLSESVSSNFSVNFDILEEPVLDEVLDNTLNGSTETNLNSNMANPEYEAKLNEIKKAKVKVNDKIGRFSSETLMSECISDYKDSLKEVADLLEKFEDLVNNVLIDPLEGVNETETTRLRNARDLLQKQSPTST